MNLYLKFQSRRPRGCGDDFVAAAFELMLEPRCYCASASSSSTKQSSTNNQVGVQTAPGAPGVGIGAGASVGTVGLTSTFQSNVGNTTPTYNVSGDTATAAAAMTLAGQVVTYGNDLTGHALTAMQSQDQHSQDLMAGLGGSAINLGGAAINLGGAAVGAAFQFAQNQSVMNYNALNNNTAMAFSTINAIDTANAAGAISAAAQDTLAASLATGQQMQQPAPIDLTGLNTPYTATTTGITSTEIVGIGLAVVTVAIFMHHGTR